MLQWCLEPCSGLLIVSLQTRNIKLSSALGQTINSILYNEGKQNYSLTNQ